MEKVQEYYVSIPNRIHELGNAIEQNIDGTPNREDISRMKQWAREMLGLLDLFDTLTIYNE